MGPFGSRERREQDGREGVDVLLEREEAMAALEAHGGERELQDSPVACACYEDPVPDTDLLPRNGRRGNRKEGGGGELISRGVVAEREEGRGRRAGEEEGEGRHREGRGGRGAGDEGGRTAAQGREGSSEVELRQ